MNRSGLFFSLISALLSRFSGHTLIRALSLVLHFELLPPGETPPADA